MADIWYLLLLYSRTYYIPIAVFTYPLNLLLYLLNAHVLYLLLCSTYYVVLHC